MLCFSDDEKWIRRATVLRSALVIQTCEEEGYPRKHIAHFLAERGVTRTEMRAAIHKVRSHNKPSGKKLPDIGDERVCHLND